MGTPAQRVTTRRAAAGIPAAASIRRVDQRRPVTGGAAPAPVIDMHSRTAPNMMPALNDEWSNLWMPCFYQMSDALQNVIERQRTASDHVNEVQDSIDHLIRLQSELLDRTKRVRNLNLDKELKLQRVRVLCEQFLSNLQQIISEGELPVEPIVQSPPRSVSMASPQSDPRMNPTPEVFHYENARSSRQNSEPALNDKESDAHYDELYSRLEETDHHLDQLRSMFPGPNRPR